MREMMHSKKKKKTTQRLSSCALCMIHTRMRLWECCNTIKPCSNSSYSPGKYVTGIKAEGAKGQCLIYLRKRASELKISFHARIMYFPLKNESQDSCVLYIIYCTFIPCPGKKKFPTVHEIKRKKIPNKPKTLAEQYFTRKYNPQRGRDIKPTCS